MVSVKMIDEILDHLCVFSNRIARNGEYTV